MTFSGSIYIVGSLETDATTITAGEIWPTPNVNIAPIARVPAVMPEEAAQRGDYIQNGDFEAGDFGWTLDFTAGSNLAQIVADGNAHQGTYALKLSGTPSTPKPEAINRRKVQVHANTGFQISFYAKVTGAPTTVALVAGISLYDAADSPMGDRETDMVTADLTSSYQQFVAYASADPESGASPAYARVRFWLRTLTGGSSPAVYVDGVTVTFLADPSLLPGPVNPDFLQRDIGWDLVFAVNEEAGVRDAKAAGWTLRGPPYRHEGYLALNKGSAYTTSLNNKRAVPCASGDQFIMSGLVLKSSRNSGDGVVGIRVAWLKSDGTVDSYSTSSTVVTTLSSVTWNQRKATVTAPANAVSARLEAYTTTDAGGGDYACRVAGMGLARIA